MNKNTAVSTIRGYIYQFDKTILCVFDSKNERDKISIERYQDLDSAKYCIQVKNYESKKIKYSRSKITKAVKSIFTDFINNKNRNYELFCHFEDKPVGEEQLTITELTAILGNSVSKNDINDFSKKFKITFSEDFQSQSDQIFKKIKDIWKLKNDTEILTYYYIIRSKIIDTATIVDDKKRNITFAQIKNSVKNVSKVMYTSGLMKFNEYSKYLNFIKKELFTSKTVNISTTKKLFIIQVPAKNYKEYIILCNLLINKFYKSNHTPSISVMLSVPKKLLNSIKQLFVDNKLYFNDGTYFNGDKLRVDDLLGNKSINSQYLQLRVIDEALVSNKKIQRYFDEVYCFTNDQTINKKIKTTGILRIVQVEDFDNIKLLVK